MLMRGVGVYLLIGVAWLCVLQLGARHYDKSLTFKQGLVGAVAWPIVLAATIRKMRNKG